jgi:uncharacterized protein
MKHAGIILLVSTIFSMFFAQLIKVIKHKIQFNSWQWGLLFETGGMPSSHSALVSTLAFEMFLFYGGDSPAFVVTVIFAIIVMYDAVGVRRQAGEQSIILHELLTQAEGLGLSLSSSSAAELRHWKRKGHTPFEVVGGILLGIIIAWLTYLVFSP